jgi:hypothetical protein
MQDMCRARGGGEMGMRFESVLHMFVASKLVIAFVDFKANLTYINQHKHAHCAQFSAKIMSRF